MRNVLIEKLKSNYEGYQGICFLSRNIEDTYSILKLYGFEMLYDVDDYDGHLVVIDFTSESVGRAKTRPFGYKEVMTDGAV